MADTVIQPQHEVANAGYVTSILRSRGMAREGEDASICLGWICPAVVSGRVESSCSMKEGPLLAPAPRPSPTPAEHDG